MSITFQTESRARIEALKELLREGTASTQDALCEALKDRKFDVTQSTISRDLRRIGAIKTIDFSGGTVYRLPEEEFNVPVTLSVSGGLRGLLKNIQHNGSIIVIHTTPGSASLVARHLDNVKPNGILGTLAGDDTIFVAPASVKEIPATLIAIEQELSQE